MKEKNKKFDVLSFGEMSAIRAGNGGVTFVADGENPPPLVKDSSVTFA